jgi:hypothetical protein
MLASPFFFLMVRLLTLTKSPLLLSPSVDTQESLWEKLIAPSQQKRMQEVKETQQEHQWQDPSSHFCYMLQG